MSLNNIKVRHFRWVLVIILILFLTPGIFLYWQASEQAEETMVEQVIARELTLARAGSLLITEFFKRDEADLLLLSEAELVRALKEKDGRMKLQLLAKQFGEGILSDIVRTDEKGIVQWVVNLEDDRDGEGISIADRDYFNWAEEQTIPGKIFVSQPLISRGGKEEGNYILVMATPIFYQEKFNGILFFTFSLKELTEKYITPLAFSPKVQSLISTQEGDIVASTISEAVGKNVLEYARQGKWKGQEEYLAMVEKALIEKKGSAVHNYHLSFPHDRLIKAITVYVPIEVGDQNWFLWIAVPYEEAINLALPLEFFRSHGFVFGLIGALVLFLVSILGIRIAQRDGFVNGFRNGRSAVKKIKKK